MRRDDVGEPPVTACGELRSCDSFGGIRSFFRRRAGTPLRSVAHRARHWPPGKEFRSQGIQQARRVRNEKRRSGVDPQTRSRGTHRRADAGPLPRPARRQPTSEDGIPSCCRLTRHDPLAPSRDRRATQARHRRLETSIRTGETCWSCPRYVSPYPTRPTHQSGTTWPCPLARHRRRLRRRPDSEPRRVRRVLRHGPRLPCTARYGQMPGAEIETASRPSQ